MNALDELNKVLEENNLSYNQIRCAHVVDSQDKMNYREFKYIDHNSEEEINDFLNFLNVDSQQLFGKIWFWNDSWLERWQYDERWEYKKFEIPDYLMC